MKGLRKSHARLRQGWKKARRSVAPEALHDWRKRVKDQSAQLRLFRGVMPDALRARRNEEKETAERLGEEHDLWVLREHLSGVSCPPEIETARVLLLDAIEGRRAVLRDATLERGGKFSAKKASAFCCALCEAWTKASARAVRKPRRAKSPPAGPAAAPISQAR